MRNREQTPLSPTCLNCEAPVSTRFCGECGQENEPPTPGFRTVLSDLWQEFLQVDGKLLKTLWYLFSRPGFLSAEYVAGRRIAYVSPFKLYFWTTALFVVFFLRLNIIDSDKLQRAANQIAAAEKKQAAEAAKRDKKQGKGTGATPAPEVKESDDKNRVQIDLGPNIHIPVGKGQNQQDAALATIGQEVLPAISNRPIDFFGEKINFSTLPKTVLEYKESKIYQSDNIKRHFIIEKAIRFKNNPWDGIKSIASTALPNILIFCVPIWAMIIKLFFPKRLYIEHLIFTLHTHVFGVICIAVFLGISRAFSLSAWMNSFFMVFVLMYNFLAARRFYAQHSGWLLIKGAGLSCAYGCILMLAGTLGLMFTLAWTLLAP